MYMYICICIYIQGASVKRFRTSKRCRVHPEDSKPYSNAVSETLFRRGRWRCVKVPSFRAGNRHFARGL